MKKSFWQLNQIIQESIEHEEFETEDISNNLISNDIAVINSNITNLFSSSNFLGLTPLDIVEFSLSGTL